MKRINISKDTNFIGSWNINDDNLCNNIIKVFVINPSPLVFQYMMVEYDWVVYFLWVMMLNI